MSRKIRISAILILLLISVCCLPASAGTISGSVSGSVTFYVEAGSDSAWICLDSEPGMAETGSPDTEQSGPGRYHGYYRISGIWADSEHAEQLIWAPSASGCTGEIYDSDSLFIRFSRQGVCAVTVEPLNTAEIGAYLSGDVFVCWDSDATWSVSRASGCTVLSEKPSGEAGIQSIPESATATPVPDAETDTAGSGAVTAPVSETEPENDPENISVTPESTQPGEIKQYAKLTNAERQAFAKQIGDHAVGQSVYALSDGNVREQPDGKAPYLTKLSAGRYYQILEVAVAFQTDNIWYKVEYADKCFGWVAAFTFATEDLSY